MKTYRVSSYLACLLVTVVGAGAALLILESAHSLEDSALAASLDPLTE